MNRARKKFLWTGKNKWLNGFLRSIYWVYQLESLLHDLPYPAGQYLDVSNPVGQFIDVWKFSFFLSNISWVKKKFCYKKQFFSCSNHLKRRKNLFRGVGEGGWSKLNCSRQKYRWRNCLRQNWLAVKLSCGETVCVKTVCGKTGSGRNCHAAKRSTAERKLFAAKLPITVTL